MSTTTSHFSASQRPARTLRGLTRGRASRSARSSHHLRSRPPAQPIRCPQPPTSPPRGSIKGRNAERTPTATLRYCLSSVSRGPHATATTRTAPPARRSPQASPATNPKRGTTPRLARNRHPKILPTSSTICVRARSCGAIN